MMLMMTTMMTTMLTFDDDHHLNVNDVDHDDDHGDNGASINDVDAAMIMGWEI